jgi:hypothetical protein
MGYVETGISWLPLFTSMIVTGRCIFNGLVQLIVGQLYSTDVYGGWGVFANSSRSLVEAPIYGADQVIITCRTRQLTEEAWAVYRQNCPEGKPPDDFCCGFKAGFAAWHN